MANKAKIKAQKFEVLNPPVKGKAREPKVLKYVPSEDEPTEANPLVNKKWGEDTTGGQAANVVEEPDGGEKKHDSDLDIDSEELEDEYFEMNEEEKKAYRAKRERIKREKHEDF
jgi:hypothetical protein